jgi:hypothetical protein
MHRGPRSSLLATLVAVAVYAIGVVTMVGLVRWGWPVFDAVCAGVTVAILALWGSLGAGRKTANLRRHRRSHKDQVDR